MMKKILKLTFYTLLILIILGCTGLYIGTKFYKDKFFTAAENRISIERNEGSFSFEWAPTDFDGEIEPHGAIYFPVQIKGDDRKFVMQWDCGAPSTIFYQPALFSIYQNDAIPDTVQRGNNSYLKDFEFSVGENIDLRISYSRLLDYGEPIDFTDSTGVFLIGTIGADFIDGQVFAMNFKTQEVTLSNDRSEYSDLAFSPFEYVGRRILLPSSIANTNALLFYDSGTSPFGLITTRNKFKVYGDPNAPDKVYKINSWGTKVLCHNKSSSTPIAIGGSVVEMNRVSFFKWKNAFQSFFMAFSDIKGLLGNKALLNSTLILDTQKSEFAVVD